MQWKGSNNLQTEKLLGCQQFFSRNVTSIYMPLYVYCIMILVCSVFIILFLSTKYSTKTFREFPNQFFWSNPIQSWILVIRLWRSKSLCTMWSGSLRNGEWLFQASTCITAFVILTHSDMGGSVAPSKLGEELNHKYSRTGVTELRGIWVQVSCPRTLRHADCKGQQNI